MIISVFLRHFKSHKNINYIPLSNGEMLTGIMGENGVGKSAILEALDTYFNGKDDRDWNVNLQAKREGGINSDDKIPFIAPVFLLEKNKYNWFPHVELLNIASEFFWNVMPSSSEAKKFTEHRDRLKDKFEETHYILLLGKKHQDATSIYIPSFEKELLETIRSFDEDLSDDGIKDHLAKIRDAICDNVTYFYIPIETDPHIYSKLENSNVQSLLDMKVHAKIMDQIKDDAVRNINKDLDGFLDDIQSNLDGGYIYRGAGRKDSLTKKDVVDKAIEAYLSIKILHKKNGDIEVPIFSLSSGEKKRVLIDLAFSFLKKRSLDQKIIILAVDEPEASLHQSACYDQFEKLNSLSGIGHQVFFTTHWYGFLPILSKGNAISLQFSAEDQRRSFDIFDLYNYREKVSQDKKDKTRKILPYDISLKSYNDLAQSIVSSCIKTPAYNWLLCEGVTEKIYLEYYLEGLIESKNLRIIPLGGRVEVKRIYDRLCGPMSDSDYAIAGKVVCLIDTDPESIKIDVKQNKNLDFLRIINREKTTKIVNVTSDMTSPPTAIEYALSPSEFVLAMREIAESKGFSEVLKVIDNLAPDNGATASGLYLNLRPSEESIVEDFLKSPGVKYELARCYVGKSPAMPNWIKEISERF